MTSTGFPKQANIIQLLPHFCLSRRCRFSLTFQEFVKRMSEVSTFQKALLDEVKAEGEKFGEDIKHLADFTSGCKKFEPWIEKAEAKKAAGMTKPKNLQEAQDCLADAQVNRSIILTCLG